jgi:SPW repeat-containing protein
MRHAYEGIHLASATSPPTVRPGELPTEQAAQPTVHAGRRGRMAGRGVWSPRTTLAYCWRSRTLLGLGAWLAVSPWTLGAIGDRHSTENALVNGVLLMGTAFWALLTRKPAPPHACGHHLPEGGVGVGVGAAGDRDRGGQLGVREGREQAGQRPARTRR